MRSQNCTRKRRNRSPHPLWLVFGMIFMMMAPALTSVVDASQIRAQPTEEATATPTEEPAITDKIVQPTVEPTEVEPQIEYGSITIHKGVCDDPSFDYYAVAFIESIDNFFENEACGAPDGEFDFEFLREGEFSVPATTALGSLSMDLPTGPVTIIESVPGGWGEPVVFCGSDQKQPDVAAGTIGVETQWPLAVDESVECWYFNISVVEDAPLHTIRVFNYVCADDFDPASDWFTYATECTTALPDVGFDLGVEGAIDSRSTDASGEIEWTDVELGPSGEISLDQAIPEGYGEPIVWCVSFPEAAADPEDFDIYLVDSLDGLISATPEQHEPFIFSCTYFNFPEDLDAAANTNTLSIGKFNCPLGAPYEEFGVDIFDYCTEVGADIEFTLTYDGYADVQPTDAAGQLTWENLPIVDFQVWEDSPNGYDDQIVYCRWLESPDELGLSSDYFLVPVVNSTFNQEFVADTMHLDCGVFNLPRHGSRVVVNKQVCPYGVVLGDPEADDFQINDYLDACPAIGNGFEFTLDNAHGSSTLETVDGALMWDDVPQGPFTVTEEIPLGYSEPLWWCNSNYYDESGDLVHGTDGYFADVTDGTISDAIDEPYGEIFYCRVFNFTDESTSSVEIHKWFCPDGFDLDVDDPSAECTEPMDGVTFQLDDLEETTGNVIPGSALFLSVPEGDHNIIEILPEGIDQAFFGSCTNNGAAVAIEVMDELDPVNGSPVLQLFVEDGDHWECDWYNVPAQSNDIVIYKSVCPEGTSYEESDDWYFDNCTEALSGIDFTATSDLSVQFGPTVDGMIAFSGFAAGVVGIQETVPPEYGAPIVVCSDLNGVERYEAPTGYFDYEFAAGANQLLTCWVFNIPGDPGDLTIYKWTCPEGYDLYAESADPASDCTEATNGIDFQFGLSGIENIAEIQTTGDLIDGGVFFDEVEYGTYKVVEVVPDGIEYVFVLECTGHIMGQLQPYPLELSNVLEIEISSGEHLACHWFNVPEAEGGTLTIVKYACTTETFVSDVDCEIYEDGQGFDLYEWSGDDYVYLTTGVTNGIGQLSWSELESGYYQIDELDGDWCHIEASVVPVDDADGFVVNSGEENIIKVYNCGYTWTWEPPTEYPNTGTAPIVRDEDRATP